MASLNAASRFASPASVKRQRDDDDDKPEEPLRKFARPTLNLTDDGEVWPHDSVTNTPTVSSSLYHEQRKYDSDEQSSMISEPGSPQDISMSSEDEDGDPTTFSHSPDDMKPSPSSPWRERVQNRNRVSTPFAPTRRSPMSVRTTGPQQHIRSRHPQEIMSSEPHLEVPSPIDEDEVPTPPSAEAAGSQLSMLSVNDMEVESTADLPTITLHPARSSTFVLESTPEFEPMDSGADQVLVTKRRQRSGAQSNGSVSPARGDSTGPRGFSMGFRADCDKCQMRIPGHMSHFTA